MGRICGPWYWGTVHRRVAEACARRRAAVTLLRALAFRARKGRLPRAGELKMPEDPFRPGKRMTYVHDKKNGRIGVYAIGWEEELPQWMKDKLGAEKVKDPKVGQWLLLEGDKGAGTGD